MMQEHVIGGKSVSSRCLPHTDSQLNYSRIDSTLSSQLRPSNGLIAK